MARPVFLELALFLTPFALYALFLFFTRQGVLDPASWPRGRLLWLAIAACLLVIGSFVVLAQFGGAPPGSTYTPARVEDGRLIPGETK
jgi:hypothetical protein